MVLLSSLRPLAHWALGSPVCVYVNLIKKASQTNKGDKLAIDMRIKRHIPTRDVRTFIHRKLILFVGKDLKRYRIFSEGDLQSSVYYLLRRFLQNDSTWRIILICAGKRAD